MTKQLTIDLSEADFKELLQGYLLGNLIAHEVNQPSKEEIIRAADLVNKLCEVGFKNKIKGFTQLEKDIYGFPQQVETDMLETYEDFIEYVASGDRDEDFEATKKQIDEMRKEGLL